MRPDKIRSFRQKLSDGHAKGIFAKSTDPAFIESAGYAGLDFSILDMEHGPADFKTIENLVRATERTTMLPVVRTAANEPSMISKALDTGALGVQVPNIGSVEEAKKAIKAARFAPRGMRGVCRFVRAAEYGNAERNEYFKESNESILILMVEGQQGLDDIDEILALPDFDILFIGPYDLSQSMGISGDIYNDKILNTLASIAKKAEKQSKYVGTFYDDPSRKEWFLSSGLKFLAYSVDTEIFRNACSTI